MTSRRGASKNKIPGRNVPSEERILRSFTIKEAFYRYTHDDTGTNRGINVILEIVSDTGDLPNWGPFREKSLVMTETLFIYRPKTPIGLIRRTALSVGEIFPTTSTPLEKLAVEIRAPPAIHAAKLSTIQ